MWLVERQSRTLPSIFGEPRFNARFGTSCAGFRMANGVRMQRSPAKSGARRPSGRWPTPAPPIQSLWPCPVTGSCGRMVARAGIVGAPAANTLFLRWSKSAESKRGRVYSRPVKPGSAVHLNRLTTRAPHDLVKDEAKQEFQRLASELGELQELL